MADFVRIESAAINRERILALRVAKDGEGYLALL